MAVATRGAATVRVRRLAPGRLLLHGRAVRVTLFTLTPVYVIALAALSPSQALFDYPRALLPTSGLSLDNVRFFLTFANILPALRNSQVVGLLTVLMSLALGGPAGYSLARYWLCRDHLLGARVDR